MFVQDDGDPAHTWISAANAVNLIRDHFEGSTATQTCLIQRAAASLIGTRCKRMKIVARDYRQSRPDKDNCSISHEFWEKFEIYNLRSTENWIAGDFGVHISSTNVLVFGVQFCREQVEEIIATAQLEIMNESSLPQRQKPSKPLPSAWLDQWANLFTAANPSASESIARIAVDAMFPSHHVTRTELRRVLPQRPKGRPLKPKT